jgi:predicted DCC family thiol-disulfide oxidoreductase YuxK
VKENDCIEVFYDATCPLCRVSRRWVEGRDHDRRLAFRDLEDPAAAGCTSGAPGGAMWVRLPGGVTASGFAGWLAVLRALPRWRYLARGLGLAPLRWLGPPVYRLVARHRHALVSR